MTEAEHDHGLLAALVEGRLDATERERVLAHVAQCVDCRRTVAELGRATADGTLTESKRSAAATARAHRWLPIAASVLVGTFAWFLLSTNMPQPDVTDPSTATPRAGNEDELLIRRSAGRTVGDKTFRMEDGVWIDSTYDASLGLPTMMVRGADERSALLARIPQLAPYTELGSRVVVTWQGTVYRFEP